MVTYVQQGAKIWEKVQVRAAALFDLKAKINIFFKKISKEVARKKKFFSKSSNLAHITLFFHFTVLDSGYCASTKNSDQDFHFIRLIRSWAIA